MTCHCSHTSHDHLVALRHSTVFGQFLLHDRWVKYCCCSLFTFVGHFPKSCLHTALAFYRLLWVHSCCTFVQQNCIGINSTPKYLNSHIVSLDLWNYICSEMKANQNGFSRLLCMLHDVRNYKVNTTKFTRFNWNCNSIEWKASSLII